MTSMHDCINFGKLRFGSKACRGSSVQAPIRIPTDPFPTRYLYCTKEGSHVEICCSCNRGRLSERIWFFRNGQARAIKSIRPGAEFHRLESPTTGYGRGAQPDDGRNSASPA